MKPFLRWVGGKQSLSADISSAIISCGFKKEKHRFFEPMFGAGAVCFELEPEHPYINDVNKKLMDVYKAIKLDAASVILHLRTIKREFDALKDNEARQEYYYNCRYSFNMHYSNDPIMVAKRILPNVAALFIFLNKTCFNGLYRENKSGEFNVPFDKSKNQFNYQEDRILRAASFLFNAEVSSCDFEEFVKGGGVGKNDYIYFDPPYLKEVDGGFTDYTSFGFDVEDHKRLAKVCRELKRQGAKVFLSASDTPSSRSIYSDMYKKELVSSRSVSRESSGRGEKRELLFISEFVI